LAEAFEAFIVLPTRTKAKRPKAPRTVKEYRQQFDAYLEPWHGRRVTKITRAEIEALHNRMATANGFYIANRVLALLKAIYNTLLDDQVIDSNPASRIREFEEQSRDRFLQADELPRFWKALHAEPSKKMQDFILLALFTGQRRSNVAAMRWEDVSLTAKLWTIPQTKTGKHAVPLSDEAIAILKWRRKHDTEGEWVFPAHHGGGHVKDTSRAWRSILKRAGLADLRVHDLRRTLGSWQTKTGASRPIVGKMLGHKREETTAIYGRLDMEPVRQSVAAATEAMMESAKGKKKGQSGR
jgi:integrase